MIVWLINHARQYIQFIHFQILAHFSRLFLLVRLVCLRLSPPQIKPKYTKTEDITVTKTDPSLLIFGGGNFQMKWAKKWLSNTLTHSHHIFIKMLWPTKEQFSIQFILFCYCYNKVIKLWWKSVIPSDNFFPSPTFSSHFYHNVIKMDHVPISPDIADTNLCICSKIVTKKYFHEKKIFRS